MWKPYHRLNYFLCEALKFSQTTLERFIESNPGFGRIEPSSEKNNEEDIEEQVHVRRIRRAKLSSVIEEDSEGDLPFMVCSPGTSTSTLTLSTYRLPGPLQHNLTATLKHFRIYFPTERNRHLGAALNKTNDISLAIGEIIC